MHGFEGSEGTNGSENLELFTIGELSQRFKITLRALRFYEARGLLTPQRAGVVRLYSKADARRLELILKGKQLGFTLSEIREMVAARAEDVAAQSELAIAPDLVVAQLESLQKQRLNIEQAIAELEATHQRLQRANGEFRGLSALGLSQTAKAQAARA